MKKRAKKALVAWILTLTMLLSMLPTAAFASKAGEESAAGESTEEVQAEESADGAAELEESGEEIEEAEISAIAEESLAVHAVLQGSGAALLSDGIPTIVTVCGETVTEDAGVYYSYYGIYGYLRFNVEVTEDGLLDIYAGNHTQIWTLYMYDEEEGSWDFLATMNTDELYEGLAVSEGTYYFYTHIWNNVTTTPISVTLYKPEPEEPSLEEYSIHVDVESDRVAVGEQTSLAFELYRDGAPLKSDDYYYNQSYWVTLSDYSYDVFRTCYSEVEKPNGETYYGDVIESYDEDGNCIGCGITMEAVGTGTLTVTVTELNTGLSQEVELSAYIEGYSLQVESTSRDCSAEVGDDVILSFTLLLDGEGVEFSDFLCTFSWNDGTEESEIFSCDGGSSGGGSSAGGSSGGGSRAGSSSWDGGTEESEVFSYDGEVLLSADGDENWLYKRSYQFTAATAGSTLLNVTVSLFDLSVDGYWRDVASASLVLTAYEDSKMYFDEVPVLNTDSDGTRTNFLGGLDVDDFRYSQNEDGSYDVSMTVYNPQDIYGAVTVYDADDNIVGAELIGRYESNPNLSKFFGLTYDSEVGLTNEVIAELISSGIYIFTYLTGGVDKYNWYRIGQLEDGTGVTEKTEISVTVPEGGYITISTSMEEPVVWLYNSFALWFDLAGVMTGDYTYVSSSEMKAETRETLMALTENTLKDVGSDALKKSVKKMVKSYGKSAGEELAEDIYTLMDVGTLLKECLNMDDDELKTMVTKALVSTGSSVSVDVLMSLVGLEAAKKAFDYLGVLADAGNFLEFFENYCDSMTGGSSSVLITLYAPGSSGRYDVTDQTFLFNDVSSETSGNSWYYSAVYWAYDLGITEGYSDSTFRPNSNCTRAEFTTFLYQLANAYDLENAGDTESRSFTDVAEGSWYYTYVMWAAENGLVSGYTDGTFRPNSQITRAEAVTMLYGFYKTFVNGGVAPELEEETENTFSDLSEDSWYYTYMLWAIQNGIVSGYPDGTCRPNTNCTRSVMVVLLYAMAETLL